MSEQTTNNKDNKDKDNKDDNNDNYRRMCCLTYKTRNVVHMGIGFICVFFAFNSQGFIEQTVISSASKSEGSIHPNAGYFSLAIIYGFSMLTNLIVAPGVDILGARWSMVLGSLMYTVFLAGMLPLNEPFLYISSALVGIGSAFLWTGQGKYLTMNTTKETSGRNSGLLWGMLQTSLLAGGLFMFGIFTAISAETIEKQTRMVLYGVFTGVCLLGNIILGLLPMSKLGEEERKEKISQTQLLLSAFRLLFTRNMLLLIVSFAYTGIELSYWSGVYSTAISFTKKFTYDTRKLIAFNAICQGIGQIIGGLCFGILGDKFRRFGRNPIVLVGYVAHLICFALSLINFPFRSTIEPTHGEAIVNPSISLALIVGAILGFGDACWNTQIYSILVDLYHEQPAQAFSILKFAQAAAATAAFFYAAVIELPWILVIMVITSTIALGCFWYVEIYAQKMSKGSSVKLDQRFSDSSPESPAMDSPTDGMLLADQVERANNRQ